MAIRCLVLALAIVGAGASLAAELETAAEIDACYRANHPETTAVQTVSMHVKDRIGAVTRSQATLYWKKYDDGRSRVMMRFKLPPDMRGAGLLMVEKADRNDMFIYLPELRRTKRITSRMSSASMFGTDFSYEEFERLQGMVEDSSTTRLADAEVGGRPTYVIEARPNKEEDSAYERIRSFIDKETCVSLKAEFYERGEQPRKILTADPAKVTRENGVWLAREQRMRDLRDETETLLVVEEVEVGKPIPRKMFSERELEAGGH